MDFHLYVGRILDTRFEVTRTKLNFALFDTIIELDLCDMEMVTPFSFDEDIHDKSGTNEYNTTGRGEGDVIKEEMESSTGREDREIIKTSWSSKDKVESGEYILFVCPGLNYYFCNCVCLLQRGQKGIRLGVTILTSHCLPSTDQNWQRY